jgi:hypothetical protein
MATARVDRVVLGWVEDREVYAIFEPLSALKPPRTDARTPVGEPEALEQLARGAGLMMEGQRGRSALRVLGRTELLHSAIVQQLLRGRSDKSPSTSRRTRRRGSTRAIRPAIRPISPSKDFCQRAGSTL